jgi:lysophospholipase L1-like esterase
MLVASLAILATSMLARPAQAGPMTYLSIGDSIAFGETTFANNPSNGDRGFVADYAKYLAGQDGGVKPAVFNTAIDGETSSSFFTSSNRILSVPGTTDASVAAWNTHYASNPAVSQNDKVLTELAAAKAAGKDVGVVTISLGANDLFKLAASPAFQTASPAGQQAMLLQTVNNVGNADAVILAEIHALAPNAKVYMLGEYNPFPADPSNPLNAIAGPAIQALNATIQGMSKSWGAQYVDTYTPFVGNESAYTYMNVIPGDVHPNAVGYSVIAGQIEAVPEPSTLAIMGLGFAALAVAARRRKARVA